jgi:hypothetical protein
VQTREVKQMGRPLTVFLPVAAGQVASVAELIQADPGTWLPDARTAGPDIWRGAVRFGRLRREVACEVGVATTSHDSIWRPLAWTPVPHAGDRVPIHETLPRFRGEIGCHLGRAVLVLDGSYEVPGGRIGELADAAGLAGAARLTASAFLADIRGRALQSAPVA